MSRRRESMELRVGERWLEVFADPILDEAGVIRGTVHIVSDITGRKRMGQEKERAETLLRQSQKMEAVGRLAGGVAHDFNNLLTVIGGYGQLLRMSLEDRADLRGNVDEILKAADHAASLTRQLLAFSRKQVIEPKPLDLNAVVSDMQKMLRRLIGEDIALRFVPAGGLPRVKADLGQIQQAILNLAVNARDAMPHGGALTLATEEATFTEEDCKGAPDARPGKFVRLSVEDAGQGMDKATIDRLFEPFFTTKDPGKGTGLGLATVYGVVKQHGGFVRIHSAPGKGSRFEVHLPALAAMPQEGPARPVSIDGLRGNGERILLVEDERSLRGMALHMLSASGYVAFEASNAEEAARVFEREGGNVDLLFSDVVLTGWTGIELADWLRARKPDLSVLLSSGYIGEQSHAPSIREKGYHFLPKPYVLQDLLLAVREAMRPR